MLTNRLTLFVALVAIAALALFTVSMVAFPQASASTNVDRSYDQIELQRAEGYAAQAAHQAYLDQRHGEQTIGAAVDTQISSRPFREAEQAAALADAERAYQEYRQGERTAGYVEDSSTYLPLPPGKQTILATEASAYLNYRRGEWSGK